jgi:GDPmannose 4,6-dehydratase
MKKSALITGISGQDGSYLAELLLSKGYDVHGVVRRIALEDTRGRLGRLSAFLDQIHIHAGSIDSYPSIFRIINTVRPDECYHLAAQSFVSYNFEDEFSTINTNINGTHYVLAALKELCPECRFYFAASSEMFGKVSVCPQNEDTHFHPRSAYGISKVAGFDLTRNYREKYGMNARSGILFNHESPRRGFEYVTRKITSRAAMIKCGLATDLPLGNLEAIRDWGHSADYMEAIWRMVQQDTPRDYVIATNTSHSVREFVETAFSCLNLNYQDYVRVDEKFFRPAEEIPLRGDSTRAYTELNWKPKHTFHDLVREMTEHDLALVRKQSSQL